MVARRWPGSILWLGAYKSRAVDQWQCASSGSLASHEYVNWGSGRPRPEELRQSLQWRVAGRGWSQVCLLLLRLPISFSTRPLSLSAALALQRSTWHLPPTTRRRSFKPDARRTLVRQYVHVHQCRSDAPHAPIVVHTVRGCCAANCYCTRRGGVSRAGTAGAAGPIVLRRGRRTRPAARASCCWMSCRSWVCSSS